MFNKKRIISVTLILLMLFAAGTVGFYVHKAQANANQNINTLQKLFLVLDLVQKNYVEEPDTDNLLIGAIDGMLESLDDPYTEYLPP